MNSAFFRKFVACFLLVTLMFTLFSVDQTSAQLPVSPQLPGPYQSWQKDLGETGPTALDLAGRIGKAIVDVVGDIVMKYFQVVIDNIFVPIVDFFANLTGKMLNYSIDFTIFTAFGGGGGNPLATFDSSIKEIWIIVRDLFNLTFIFTLLWIAIKKIFGTFEKGLLFSVIVSAIFINFSFFATRTIIDIGNVFATSIYNQMESKIQSLSSTNGGGGSKNLAYIHKNIKGEKTQIQLSEIIRVAAGSDNIGESSVKLSLATKENPAPALWGSILKLITFIILTFIFLSMTFLMVGRFVILILLMASSPIGFLFGSIPKLGSLSTSWWNHLIKQVALAPVFMFFMFMVVNISQNQALKASRSGNVDVGIIFNYVLIISLLVAAIKVSSKLSGEVAGMAQTATKFVAGAALVAATGGAALAGRQIIGRGAAALGKTKFAQGLQERGAKGGFGGGLSNLALKGIKGTSNASFDLKSSKTAQYAMTGIKNISGGTADIQGALNSLGNMGKGSGEYGKDKKGFTGWKEKQKEIVEKRSQEYDKVAQETEKRAARKAQEKNQVQEKKNAEEEAKKKLDEAENNLATASQADRATRQTERDAAKMEYLAKKGAREIAEKDTVAGIENRAETRFEDDRYVSPKDPRKVAYKAAEAKVAALRTAQQTNKDYLDGGAQTKDEYDKEEAKLQQSIKTAMVDMEKAKAEGIKSQVKEVEKEILNVNNPDKDNDKVLIGILKARQMREDYAKQLEGQIFTLSQISRIPGLGGDERKEFAEIVRSDKGVSKVKSEEEKTLAALLKQIEKLNDKK